MGMNKSKILQGVMLLLNHLIPKKDVVLFNSYPAYSDNAKALYQYIVRERPDLTARYKLIWGQEKDAVLPKELASYPFQMVFKKSLKGIFTFLSAKYVFSTHGYFPGVRSGRGQVQINLWHGCGYKSITQADRIYRGDINIVTGSVYVPIHEKVFDMKQGSVYPIGLPRNDSLFSQGDGMAKLGIQKDRYKKIYIWMPTYRKAKEGHDATDGNADTFTISTMTRQDLERLNTVLQQAGYLLVVKPHPMDSKAFENISGFNNIITVTNSQLTDAGIQLYELLSETDGLLSDYSSVVIDYLLLQRPVVMVMADLDSYQQNRGFVFENVKAYFPGPMIVNLEELLHYFQHSDAVDAEWKPKRTQLSRLFHDNFDDRSCERVCDLIFGKKNSA